jgi:Fe-S-cluster containining protein
VSLKVLTVGENGAKCCGRGRCCENAPGWFAPGEMEKAAEWMGVPPEQFFAKYIVLQAVRLPNEPGNPMVEAFVPTKVDAKGEPLEGAGRRSSRVYQYMNGPCVFYKDRLCAIHPVRPLECRRYFCEQPESQNITHEEIGKLWYDAWRESQKSG